MSTNSPEAFANEASNRWKRPLCLALGALVTTALAACGSSGALLNTVQVEHSIADTILAQRHLSARVVCPSDVPRKAGTRFACTAEFDAGSYPVAASVTDDRGHVVYWSESPLVGLDVARVEHAIARSILERMHAHAAVSCPVEVLQRVKLTFECSATYNGRPYRFVVTEVDAEGRVRYLQLG